MLNQLELTRMIDIVGVEVLSCEQGYNFPSSCIIYDHATNDELLLGIALNNYILDDESISNLFSLAARAYITVLRKQYVSSSELSIPIEQLYK